MSSACAKAMNIDGDAVRLTQYPLCIYRATEYLTTMGTVEQFFDVGGISHDYET